MDGTVTAGDAANDTVPQDAAIGRTESGPDATLGAADAAGGGSHPVVIGTPEPDGASGTSPGSNPAVIGTLEPDAASGTSPGPNPAVIGAPEPDAASGTSPGSNPAVIGVPEYGGTESGALFDVDMPVRLASAISPSRAGDFMQCPLLFRLRVVDKVPEPPNAAAARGTLVHAVLDRLFDLPAGGRTPDEAAALLQPEWDRLLAKNPELAELFATPQELAEWLASAKSLVGRYFTLEDPNRLEPAQREWFVRTVIGEGEDRFVLHGVVDRLDVAPNGLLRVVDYKTGKAPPAAYEAKNLFQMKFYALVLWKLRGVVPKRLQLIFLGSGDVLTYDPDERDLLGVERKITAVWEAIRAAAQRREWPASPSRLCDWCSFKEGCPAHGGEVPPAPIVEFTPVT